MSDVLAGGWAKALSADRKQFNMFFNKMLDGFAYHKIVVDKSGKPVDYIFVEVNHAFEKMTGLKRKQIIGKKVTDVLVGIEKDPADWIGIYGKVALTGEPVQFENHAEPLDKWFKVSAYCPEKGYFVALFEDITERKKTEEGIRLSEQRYRSLYEAISGGVVVQDQNGSITDANDTACEILGLTRDQMQGRTSTDPNWHAIHEDNSPFPGDQHPAMITLRTGKALQNVVMGVFHPNTNQYRWIIINSEPIIDAETKKVTAAVTTFVDITDLKKAEDALSYNNQRLELLTKVTSQLLSATNPQKLIQKICEEVMAFLKCDVFFNFLVDEQKQKLHLNAYAGVPAETAATFEWLSFGEAVCGCAAREGNRIVCENIPDTQDHRTALVSSFGVKAYCANPIFSSGKVIGTLSFGSKRKMFFSADDLAVMKTVTAQVSVAMDKERSEEALRESEERFRISLKNAPVSVAAQDCELRYIWAYNQETANPEQIIGRLDSEIFTTEEAAHLDAIKRRVLKEGVELREQQWFNRPSGPIFLDVTWSPLYDSKGQIIGVSSATIDLTDMKRTEIALQESEQRWSTTLSSIGDAVIATDTSGKTIFMNRVAEELTGWTLSEGSQTSVKKVFNIINEHTRLEVENPIAKALREGIVVGLANHTVLIRKDGSEIPIDDSAAPIKDKDGKTTGVVLIFRDITERQKAEKDLLESERRLKRSQKIAHLGSWELDLIKNKLTWSDEIYRIFGLKPQEFDATYEAFLQAVHPDDRKAVDSAYSESLHEGRDTYEVEHRVVRKSTGEIRVVYEKCDHVRDKTGKIIRSIGMVQDITERKKAEEELKRSEENARQRAEELQKLMDIIPAAVWLSRDPECKVIVGNQAANTFYEAGDEENVSAGPASGSARDTARRFFRNGKELMPPELPMQEAAANNIEIKNSELEVIVPSGGKITILGNAKPLLDEAGNVRGCLGAFVDITERKKAEEELDHQKAVAQLERERLSSVLNGITDEVWFADREKKFTLANPSAVNEFKLASSTGGVDVENLAKSLEVLRPDGSPRPVEEAPPLRALKGEILRNQEEIIRTPATGELRTRLVSSAPVRDVNGAIIGSVSVVRDITELKKAEEATARQAELIDLSPDAIIVRKLDGTITFWSKGAEKLYGWRKDEAVGQVIHTLLMTEFPQSLKEVLKKLKLDGKWSGEISHTCKNGDKVVVQSYWLGKFNAQGEIVEMMESNVDITERIRTQAKLEESAVVVEEYANQMEELANKRAEQLKEAERLAAIGATAGMVGHDIRNPLQSITGDLYLAKTDLAAIPESEEKNNIQENLSEIEKNVDYINKIVADLQDFARPLKPDLEETDLKLVIDDLLKKNCLPENIDVSVEVEIDARKVVADSTFITRIMYNLVNNAVQAMPKGGKLTIHAFKEANDTVITVKDTGVGIPEAVKGKLFTPMFTTKAKGQGFGLAVVKRMSEVLGGSVAFESQEGKGTMFTILLPAAHKN